MPAWILDDTPLDLLANHVDATDAGSWPSDELFVAQTTRSAASGVRKALLEASGSPFHSFSVVVGSQAFDIVYSHLRQPAGSTANLAELEAIAWALTERPDAVFVTTDKRAAVIALAELGRGRVAHAFDLWLLLRDDGRIDPSRFRKLCEATRRKDQSLPNVPLRCSA